MKTSKFILFFVLFSSCHFVFSQTAKIDSAITSKTESEKSVVSDTVKNNKDFPPLSEGILNAKFVLVNNQSVSLADYKNKVVVLFFLESWCGPCLVWADNLNKFLAENSSSNLEIIGLSMESSVEDKKEFRKVVRGRKITYKMGFTNNQVFDFFDKISKMNGIPQSFVIYDGKIQDVFLGAGNKIFTKMKETIIKTQENNNLQSKK